MKVNNHPVMADLKSDLTTIRESQRETSERIVDLAVSMKDMVDQQKKIDRTVYGERDKDTGVLIVEGLFNRVERHEHMYQDYTFLKKFIYVVYVLIGIIGFNTVLQIMSNLKTFAGH